MNNYPVILIPTEISLIKTKKPEIPKAPLKPEIPNKIIPIKPKEVSNDSSIGGGFIILLILVGGGFLLTILGSQIGFIMLLIGVFLFFYWIINWSKIQETKKNDYQKYLEDLKNYNIQIKNIDSIYKKDLNHYETIQLIKYQSELIEFEKNKIKLESEEYLKKYREVELFMFFLNSTTPLKLDKNYSKGVSELFFLKYLKKNFGDNVLIDHSIINDDFEGIPFNPDFVIYDSESYIYIDIEIDEPYIGKDGTPIHYLNSNDDYRNDFFLENNWIVIRFAEIQIIKFPEKCCDIIKSTLSSIKNEVKVDVELIKLKIENYPRWDKEEANRLAFTRFRNKYLPNELTESIENEIMELEKKFLQIDTKKDDLDYLPF